MCVVTVVPSNFSWNDRKIFTVSWKSFNNDDDSASNNKNEIIMLRLMKEQSLCGILHEVVVCRHYLFQDSTW